MDSKRGEFGVGTPGDVAVTGTFGPVEFPGL